MGRKSDASTYLVDTGQLVEPVAVHGRPRLHSVAAANSVRDDPPFVAVFRGGEEGRPIGPVLFGHSGGHMVRALLEALNTRLF